MAHAPQLAAVTEGWRWWRWQRCTGGGEGNGKGGGKGGGGEGGSSEDGSSEGGSSEGGSSEGCAATEHGIRARHESVRRGAHHHAAA
jgi:hypothetical protein